MNVLLERRKFILKNLTLAPFNAAATAAIKASFTAEQWETIRLWGKTADAYLVAAVNAFAAEDPRILCSLVSGLGITRWLNNGGTGAYIDMNFIANDYANSYQYDTIWKANAISNNTSMIGAVSNGAAFGQMFLSGSECQVWGGANWANTGLSFNVAANTEYDDSIKFVFSENKGYRTMNGASKENSVGMSVRVNRTTYLFAFNNAGSVAQNANCQFAKVMLYGDDVLVRHLIPGIVNGVNGMIDCVEQVFYPNAASSGSFTIEEV